MDRNEANANCDYAKARWLSHAAFTTYQRATWTTTRAKGTKITESKEDRHLDQADPSTWRALIKPLFLAMYKGGYERVILDRAGTQVKVSFWREGAAEDEGESI